MRVDAEPLKLKNCYLHAHLIYCLLTATCLLGWLKTTQQSLAGGSNLLWWIVFMSMAILALILAQHKIITQTLIRDHRNLHLYKTLYTATICIICIPIIIRITQAAGSGLIIIVPVVILASIVCGTVYGVATALVTSSTTLYMIIATQGYNSTLLIEQILLLALLGTTAWFIGQSFEYITNLYQRLLTSEDYLEKTLDSLGIATLHVSRSGDIIHSNKRFNELLDINITGSMSFKNIVQKHLPFLSPVLVNLLVNIKEATPVIGQAIDSRGRLIPVQCIAYPVNSWLEDNSGVLICILDISLSPKPEEEKILTNYFINFINAGVIITDATGKIIEMNRQAEHFLCISKKNALNRNFSRLLDQLAGKEPGSHTDFSCELKMGDRSLLVNCAFLGDNSGRSTGSIYIINDISMRKEMERKMLRSATLSAIGELAAGTAHEIRNPLTSIRGFLQLMQEKHDARIRDMTGYLKIILTEVDRINTIIADFLKLARPGKIEMEPVNLDEIIDSIWSLMHNEAVMRDVKLSRYQDPGLPPVMGNVDMIKQVVINLVNNAVQATGPNGTVRISTTCYRGGVRLSVEDDGPGISESLQSRIFDPYFTTRDEGTGLGLAITNKIVNDHNGSISLSSTPGKGAKFDVDFPPYLDNFGIVFGDTG